MRELTLNEVQEVSGGRPVPSSSSNSISTQHQNVQNVGKAIAFVGNIVSWIPGPTMFAGRALAVAGGIMLMAS